MPTLDDIRRTERNLLVIQVALRRLLQEEAALFSTPHKRPVLNCWVKTTLTRAHKTVARELAILQARIANFTAPDPNPPLGTPGTEPVVPDADQLPRREHVRRPIRWRRQRWS
ncbi:hypothetical protein ES703_26472 [subsurface metagenome]